MMTRIGLLGYAGCAAARPEQKSSRPDASIRSTAVKNFMGNLNATRGELEYDRAGRSIFGRGRPVKQFHPASKAAIAVASSRDFHVTDSDSFPAGARSS
jgi:hypothetical protein